ncbi:MAG TPA: right-handed parallel beta-helix repeat-containing protein [Polyangiaceae bacterium]|nr:right-handed parallel beta-helix repeat-containing protein [Polyangiaceae bacterium]
MRNLVLGVAASALFFSACGDSGSTDGDGAGGGGGVTTGSGGSPPISGPMALDCTHKGSGTDYPVGPGQTYETLGDVPFETLKGGDTVRIFYKPEPYREKIMIGGQGTAEQPIRVCGVAGPNGELPVIDGNGATTRPTSDFPFEGHQVRGVVVLGHRNHDPYDDMPGPFVLEGLAITGGTTGNTFTDASGATAEYSTAAAGIFVQRGRGVVIRGCEVYGNANGIFSGTSGGEDGTYDVLVEANYVHDNGLVDSDRQHNVYDESIGITYQFNRFDPPRAGSLGANVKDRSSGVVFRYNWVDGGAHVLDLVEAQEAKATTVPMAEYHQSYVYGNVFIRRGLDGSMIHYGGDSGLVDDYRKGTLFFYGNTLAVDNAAQGDYDLIALTELTTNDEHLWSRNNVIYLSTPTSPVRPVVLLGPRDGETHGIADVGADWVDAGVTPYRMVPDLPDTFYGTIDGFETQPAGASAGLVDPAGDDFRPTSGSALIGGGVDIDDAIPAALVPAYAYRKHRDAVPRSDESAPTQGALLP